jgi:hypothetical protein
MIKLRKVLRFQNGNQKLKYIDTQYNGKKEKNKVFKLIITMSFSRGKHQQKQNAKQKQS